MTELCHSFLGGRKYPRRQKNEAKCNYPKTFIFRYLLIEHENHRNDNVFHFHVTILWKFETKSNDHVLKNIAVVSSAAVGSLFPNDTGPAVYFTLTGTGIF